MIFNKGHGTEHAALVGVGVLAVVLLSFGSFGTASAAYYPGSGHNNQPKPTALPKQVTLVEEGKNITVTPAELGWQLDTQRISAASQHKGLPITNALNGTNFFNKYSVPAYTKVNQAALTQKVTAIADATQQAPADAKIITQNGGYVISPPVTGERVDVAKAVQMIKSALVMHKTTINLPIASLVPTVTEASLQPQLAQLKAQQAAAIAAAKAKPVTPHSCADNPAGRQLILVSVSQQHLWACNGSSQAYETAITSGAYQVGDATPTGTWHIYSKSTNIHLTGPGYDDFVNYWMAFYSDYGFHDSSWQTFPYGSSDYASQGSHGCVHLPAAAMAWLFNWAPVGTTVTITG